MSGDIGANEKVFVYLRGNKVVRDVISGGGVNATVLGPWVRLVLWW